MIKFLKSLFWLTGVLLLAWAFKKVDLTAVGNLISEMRFRFIIVLLPFFLVTVTHTIAWELTFPPQEVEGVRLWKLWRIRQIGEAFNTITPLGTVGGEPVKAQLLKEHQGLSLKQGLAAGLVTRTTNLMGLTIFLVVGIVLIFNSSLVTNSFKHISLAGLVLFSTLIFLFLLFQIKEGINVLASLFTRLPFGKVINTFLENLKILSKNNAGYYRKYQGRCGKSVGYMVLGWIFGILELYIILWALGHPISFIELWVIEALLQLIRAGSFFIPLNLGVQESGLVLIFVEMGMVSDLGLAVSLVRRVKDLIWVAGGLLMGWTITFRKEVNN